MVYNKLKQGEFINMRDTSKTTKEFEKALFKLLENKNYHDITVNEICELSNKTKMTFYHYYKDKDVLHLVSPIMTLCVYFSLTSSKCNF